MEAIMGISEILIALPDEGLRLTARQKGMFCDPYPWIEENLVWGTDDPDLYGFGPVPKPESDDD